MRLLHGQKIKFIVLLFSAVAINSNGQFLEWARRNNPEYDRRKISYGFSIGLHTSAYQIKYSKQFLSADYDTVQSIMPPFKPGFSLGFLVNRRFNENFDVRIMPKASFYDHLLNYNYTSRRTEGLPVETTIVEIPMLLKYKSARRGNVRMYMVGGVNPGIEASGKDFITDDRDNLQLTKTNLSAEAGIGFDLYFPLFKFSPEIRFSRGMRNILKPTGNGAAFNIYRDGISEIRTNTIAVYLIFQ